MQELIEVDDFPMPSPFINGVQYAWDSTALEYLKRCKYLHKFKKDGWEPKEEAIALRFGREYHKCLQDYEILKALGRKHKDCVFDVVRNLLFRLVDWNPDDKKRNRDTLVRTVVWYLEKFKDDNAKTLILTNGDPAVEITFSFELDFGPKNSTQPYVLCGKLDRVVDFNEDLFVMDRKTTTWGLGATYQRMWTPHNQMSLYTLAGKRVFMTEIKGVIIDAAQLLIGSTNYDRFFIYRTQEQLDEWLHDLEAHLRWYEHCLEFDRWPQDDTSCDKYGGCTYREVCSKPESVRQGCLRSSFEQVEPWNPLAPR